MKRISMIVLMVLCLGALAQSSEEIEVTPQPRTVQCAPSKAIFEYLVKGEFKEVPFWMADDVFTKSKYVLLVNAKTKTWTLVQYDDKNACVIGTGENHTPIYNGPVV